MGLIARQIEAAGIPTLSLTSALSITRSVKPPRAAFVDHPLGHTAGKAHEPARQRELLRGALGGFDSIREPGGIVSLDVEWADDDAWKEPTPPRLADRDGGDTEAAAEDDRTARHGTPQYQSERDRELAEAALAAGGCVGCVFPGADRPPG